MAPQASTSVAGSVSLPSTAFSIISESTAIPPGPPPNSDMTFALDEDPVYNYAVVIPNSISVLACVIVVTMYIFLRRKNPRLMNRTSLQISIAMACTDGLFHAFNLAGYGNLPKGFACAFVGGWLFDFPSLLSMFYACSLALDTQLVFVHGRTVKDNYQVLFLAVPGALALLITIPALIAGIFGFDEVFSYCWMNTHGLSDETVLIHALLGSDSWLCLAFGYLTFAVPLICYSLFSSRGSMAGLGERSKRPADRVSPRLQTHCSTDAEKSLAATLAWRDIERRVLTIRVLGYIMVPIISIIPGVILDILGRISQAPVPSEAVVVVSIISGFMGTFNAALFSIDPSVLAVIYPPRVRKHPINHQSPTTRVPIGKATITYPSPAVITTRFGTTIDDNGMDYKGYFAVPNPRPSIYST